MPRASEIALLFFVIGASFLVLAFPVGILEFSTCWDAVGRLIGVVDCPADQTTLVKEVGFLWAPNWALAQVLVFPPFLYFVFHAVQAARRLLPQMIERDMLVTERFRVLRLGELEPMIRRRLVWGAVLTGVLTILVTITLWTDFSTVVNRYYDTPELVKAITFRNGNDEADWSIAAPACRAFNVTMSPCSELTNAFGYQANRVFAALAYIFMPWVGSVVLCGFLVLVLAFVTVPVGSDFRNNNKRVVPDLRSRDPRCGFEVFEELFVHAIGAALMAFVFGYLVAVQNIYLRSHGAGLVTDVVFGLHRPPVLLAQPNIIAVGALAILLLAAVGVAMIISRVVGLGGRNTVLKAIEADNPDITRLLGSGLDALQPDEVRQRLASNFDYWPVPWASIPVVAICFVVGLASLAFVSYGVVAALAGVILVLLLVGLRRWRARPLRILMAVSNPPEQEQLDLLSEMRAVINALRQETRGTAIIDPAPAAQWQDIEDRLAAFKPTVLHFSGHGDSSGIYLNDDKAGGYHVEAEPLRRLLAGSGVRLVVLNCCYSEAYAETLVGAVDTVVGIVGSPYDAAAREFSLAFYRSLAGGVTVEQAVHAASKAANMVSERLGDAPHQFATAGRAGLVIVNRSGRVERYFGLALSASRA